MVDETLNLRVVDAVERVWKSILAIREFASQFTFFQSVLLPSEYNQVLSERGLKTVPQMSEHEFYSQVRNIAVDVETVRPFIGETIWLLYDIYYTFAVRQAAKVQDGIENKKLYPWNQDYKGSLDIAILKLLSNIFTEQELKKANESDGLGVTAWIMKQIEIKILNDMNDLIFHNDFHELDLDKQLAIQDSITLINLGEIQMGDKYIVGQAGAVGPGAHANGITFNQIWNQIEGTIDLPGLVAELAVLRRSMKDEATEPEQDIAIGAVAAAEQAAKSGNGPKALEFLKSAGKWSLDVAQKIGIGLATAAIKSALGV
jgi:hypothetical protein